MNPTAENRPITADLYRQILAHMPIACVDVVIPSSRGVLLVWRDNEPAKNQWWLPGGRVLKGETLADCAVRKAREEVGLEATFERIVYVDETIFDTGPWGIPVHSVNVCVLLSVAEGQVPMLDGDHSGARWVSSIGEIPLHNYVQRCLNSAGCF